MELAEFKKLMKKRDYRESLSTFGRLPYGEQCLLVAEAGDTVRNWVERIAADPWLRHWLGPLVRSTVLPKPQADAYGLGLLQDEEFSFFEHNRGPGKPGVRLTTVLRKHPDVLEDDLWRLFCVGGVREFSLAGQDNNDSWSWAEAIRELAETGDIDRGRRVGCELGGPHPRFHQVPGRLVLSTARIVGSHARRAGPAKRELHATAGQRRRADGHAGDRRS